MNAQSNYLSEPGKWYIYDEYYLVYEYHDREDAFIIWFISNPGKLTVNAYFHLFPYMLYNAYFMGVLFITASIKN